MTPSARQASPFVPAHVHSREHGTRRRLSTRIPQWLPTTLGVFVSAGLSTFFYLKTDVSTGIATLAGLTGITVALQLELLLKSKKAEVEEVRRNRIVAGIEQVSWLPEVLDGMLRHLRQIETAYGNTEVVVLARKAFDDCGYLLTDLQRGLYVPRDGESANKLMRELTAAAQTSLRATTSDSELDFWASGAGRRYLRLHQRNSSGGLNTQRIFIYQRWTARHESIAAEQQALGIEVHTIPLRRLRAAQAIGVIIWDDTAALDLTFNAAGEDIFARFSFARQDVDRLTTLYGAILEEAQLWAPGSIPLEGEPGVADDPAAGSPATPGT
ncbi:hypothetical protein ACFQZ4_20210 [Catellatospora coxensis]|uniref:Uncharacterized protein n=1 Tax=Catellatospora coxensis TaxID=310354 RepID=A0A8J3KYR2_9ACTN|nr:hypothetical protein [Catellatospora coxensis]GIG04540.1 hypothetical protein Cco03nite_12400 [Catellatospora coxensis]